MSPATQLYGYNKNARIQIQASLTFETSFLTPVLLLSIKASNVLSEREMMTIGTF